jgi:hypothetical protein
MARNLQNVGSPLFRWIPQPRQIGARSLDRARDRPGMAKLGRPSHGC